MRFVKDSPLEVGFRVWSLSPPAPSLTVVVKGTFDAAAGDPAPFAQEQVPATGEVYWEDDAERSLRAPSDYPLLKPLGECFVTGKAWAPRGRPAQTVACRFKIGPIEKSFAVIGDRTWRRGVVTAPSQPAPFTEMELSMERAFGGPGYAANPWGRGRAEVGGEVLLPNLEQPRSLIRGMNDRPDPVVIGALPVTWPDRARYGGTYDQRYMRERWPWLPADFDWRFFLEAPPDQRLREGFWRGDERIELHNLHPAVEIVRSRLPAIAPRVFLNVRRPGRQETSFDEVALKLDMVTWDGAIGKLLLTWRGLVEVASETLDEIEHLFVAHDPLSGPSRSRAELKARFDALLKEEEDEEVEAEGTPPPSADTPSGAGAAEEFVQAPPPAEPDAAEPSPDEQELAAKMAELETKMAALGIAPPEQDEAGVPAPDPKALREKLSASGLPISPELEAMLVELEAPPPPAQEQPEEAPPEPPPSPEGRALVEARLAAGEPLSGLDLSGADLSGMDLHGQDLSESILRGVSLAASNLARARLDGAILSESELVRADLRGASLAGADLGGANARWAELSDATLEDADLEGAHLTGARLERVMAARALFVQADLSEAVLAKGDFTEADFERARLDGADLMGATLADATLEDASASHARFDTAVMTKARCAGLKAKEGRFGTIDAEDSFWERAELSRANFSFSKLTRADFSDAILIGAEMDGCAMRQARFDRANAHSLRARKADLMEANFDSAELTYADLRGANLFGAELWRARTSQAQLTLANLTRTKLEP